jgi:type IV secretion system protein VirB8
MNLHRPEVELDNYFRDARSWAEDKRVADARSTSIAWIIALIATTIAALEAVALAGLVPLKQVVPHLLMVDRQTGHVTTLDPSRPMQVGSDSALARSMLAQYVTSRETIDRASVAAEFRKVLLWSGESARASYLAKMDPDSRENPLATLPKGTTVQTKVRSISLLDEGQALVRFELVTLGDGGSERRAAPYASIIRFRFRDRPLSESDRFINPLGFEVVRYRRDAEAVAGPPEGRNRANSFAANIPSVQARQPMEASR